MDLVPGSNYDVKVFKIIKSGVLVQLKDESTELIHISNISSKFVGNIADFVTVGETYKARAQVGKIKDVELSLKHLDLGPYLSRPAKSEHRSTDTSTRCVTTQSKEGSRPSKSSIDKMLLDLREAQSQDYSYDRNRKSKRKDRREYKSKRRRDY